MPPPHGSTSTSSASVARYAPGRSRTPTRPRRHGPRSPRGPRRARSSSRADFGGVGQFGHEIAVLRRQGHDVLRADGDRGLPSAASGSAGRPGRRRRGVAARRSAQRRAPCASSNTAAAPAHTLRLDGSAAWTTRTPAAAATRSTSSRSVGADQRERSRCGHHPTLRAGGDTAPSPRRRLWMKPDLWTQRFGQRKRRSATTADAPSLIQIAKWPQKRDDPRQGGRRRRSSCISPGGSG